MGEKAREILERIKSEEAQAFQQLSLVTQVYLKGQERRANLHVCIMPVCLSVHLSVCLCIGPISKHDAREVCDIV